MGSSEAKVDAGGDLVLGSSTKFVVRKLSGATGSEQWRFTASGSIFGDAARDVTVDDAGNVTAAGYVYPSISDDIVVVKLDGTYGVPLWTRQIDSGLNAYDFATAVVAVPGAAGDVIVAGSTNAAPTNDLTVMRLDGTDGSTQWTYTLPDPGNGDTAETVGLDGAGNVYAAGYVGNEKFCVVKLLGGNGAEIWRRELDGHAYRVVVAANGDVIAAGTIDGNFGVVRLAAADGAVVWSRMPSGSQLHTSSAARGVAIDAAGDVFAAGYLLDTSAQIFTVTKIAGATGAELWVRQIHGDSIFGSSYAGAEAIVVDPSGSGDVVTGGAVMRIFGVSNFLYTFSLFRLDGATGATEWSRTREALYPYDSDPRGGVSALAADTSGHVFAVGTAGNNYATAAVRLGFDGTPGLVTGRQLLVKDRDGHPEKRSILAHAKSDPLIATPPPGDANDPRSAGARLRLVNPTTTESATFDLPGGAAWSGLGNPPGTDGYRYADPAGQNGPCNQLIAKRGKLLQFKCSARRGSIPLTLDESAQATLTATVQFGTELPQCFAFGYGVSGTVVKRDDAASSSNPSGIFSALGYSNPGFGFPCDP